ncbi:hypothetical protein GBAR_LOCUS16763 [Geodia barretti]|uniref:Uncharacterized protein n=1 Tax=Geodia barretti TaxID=519541 RepID=A0AA35SIX7_GEOBA|nr:hypothetical protein GBAR_LOCUS16763 [Geodia barretti]
MFVIHPNVTASVNSLFSEQYNLTSYYSSLQLTFRLTCLPPHSGPGCSLIYDRSSTYSSHRVTPTSITSVMVSPSPTVVRPIRPSPEDQTPSIPLVTLAIICTGAGVLLSIIIVVVLLVILIIRKRNEEKIDDSAFRLLHDVDVTEKEEV